jgi:hypothetical protein
MFFREQAAKLWRVGLAAILSLSFAFGVLVVLVHVRESVVRSRSEAMYAEFLKLHLGETTKAEIEILRGRFAGSLTENVDCGGADCEYTIGNVWGYSPWFLLTRLAHDHMPSSQLTLKTNGNLCRARRFMLAFCTEGIRHTRGAKKGA